MQDMLLAQKRDLPAYCFQHLDLELRSDGAGANFAAAGATRAPLHDVVACFEPEWNSLDVNNTRSFNILGGIHGTGMHSFAAFAPAAQIPRAAIMRTGSEVFVISGNRFGRQPLENQQIEFRCLADEAGQQRVDLAAVVGIWSKRHSKSRSALSYPPLEGPGGGGSPALGDA